jgi:uncharacterized protein (TIGR01777 family)
VNVLVTGGTGFVGNILVNLLVARNDRVVILTRSPERARTARVGVTYQRWPVDVSRFDAIVNLAGAGVIDRRWTADYKRELVASRVDLTRAVVDAIAAAPKRPHVLVSASAVGYYGDRGEEELPEDAAPAGDFLARLCVEWEAAAHRASDAGVRVALVRIGLVLGRRGGALERMVPIFRLGLGGPFGTGRAWFPWIHTHDLGTLVIHAIANEGVSGPLNAAAPGIVRNRDFVRTLGRALSRPAILPVPPIALRAALGESARVLTASQRVVPARTLASGFRFQWPELEPALTNLLHKG